ncbi:alpha-N-acetylgalactosaminidase [Panthera pardus]|uniref:Alpha-galactosidase n=2 Tax=Panthera TaxID=9688 RepID=A0A8C8XQ81_PANLE|nr:alpha-N-acetylgalactosaminidase [Panthera pardus]XP_019302602.2 alpha-N-acetylgalactosaminidase [Panthera pardus]XP_049483545.1 alpha-N-acetylgalactosaminidase [Panthera uncia]XP_049483546.1 alpha-N-acetylgalactosaminidase [Panthera uncia]XP_060512181.1 alpha-N-acetylgalactosaminidase [Panthera onca]XP_060512182.1 alpha-N-acetylgalactosaminidase [Panthera onca]
MLLKAVLLLALVARVLVLENGLLRKPPMGWLAWERFRCNTDCDEDPKNCISERLFMEMADHLAQDGWRDLGYTYLNMDDCWIGGRDAKGRLIPDPKRFPNGIAFLADYAHSLGLKLGIYEDMGNFTCMGYPGITLDKVTQDAQTFAEWKVDMLKLDGCFSTPEERAMGYPKMAAALNATGRPIAFSCSWPAYEGGLPPKVNYSLLAEICNVWRNYDDIQDSWSSVLSILDWFVDHQDILQPVAGPGHWNDPDMLLIGNFGLSFEQARAQMALWTVLAAPLFMSTDLRTISAQNMDILQNPLMIKINQDPLGIQGRRILKEKSHIEVYVRPLADEASALVFFSRRTDMPYRYHSSLAQLNFNSSNTYEAQNVYTGDVISGLHPKTNFTVVINPSGVVMWYLYPIRKLGKSQQ